MEMRRPVFIFRDKFNTSATHAEKPPVAINTQAFNGSGIAYCGAYCLFIKWHFLLLCLSI